LPHPLQGDDQYDFSTRRWRDQLDSPWAHDGHHFSSMYNARAVGQNRFWLLADAVFDTDGHVFPGVAPKGCVAEMGIVSILFNIILDGGCVRGFCVNGMARFDPI
jgi:hypothetical protein